MTDNPITIKEGEFVLFQGANHTAWAYRNYAGKLFVCQRTNGKWSKWEEVGNPKEPTE